MNILIIGPQGAGKGTQAARIAAKHGIPHVSTGEMFRVAIASGSPLGQQVEPLLAAGELVPDEITIELIRDRLGEDDAVSGFVLDGFPRTLPQADALDAMLLEIGRELDIVLFFDLADEVATERMLGRARAEGRTDDTPEVIARRLTVYHEQTEPVVSHYRAAELLVTLHAAHSIEDVSAEISTALAQLGARQA